MGGSGSGRKPSEKTIVNRQRENFNANRKESFNIPNLSGDHYRGIKRQTPVNDYDLANKKYVDDEILAQLEDGTAQGQMAFWDATAGKWVKTETSELFWDDTNKRVGIGTTSPNYSLDVDEIGNSGGDFKIQPDVQGDVTLFEDTDVADNENGKSLYLYRKTSEGDSYLQFYINQYNKAQMKTNRDFYFVGDRIKFTTTNGHAQFRVTTGNQVQFQNNEFDNIMVVEESGKVGIGTTSPDAKLDVNSDKIIIQNSKTPSSASDTGTTGTICWDASYIYICTATNTWKRAAISSW